MKSTYGEKYYEKLLRNLDMKNISSESIFLLNKMKIKELSDKDNAIANTDLHNIYLPSMKKVMGLIEKSSLKTIKNMEILIVKQQEVLESILDHEVAHSLEYIYKKIGMNIYNSHLLPKLKDGSLNINDEKSFVDNIDVLRKIMIDEFKKNYSPNDKDILEFSKFVEDYYLPDGPFGMIDRIAMVDNYIVDIFIENDIANLHSNKEKIEFKFIGMRGLLYSQSDNFSIYKCMQIYIDPRFDKSKTLLSKIHSNKEFLNILEMDTSSINIDKSLFSLSNPDYTKITIKDILNEIKLLVEKLRTFDGKTSYIKFKNDHSINSDSITFLATKLAKILEVKNLEMIGEKESEIDSILSLDSTLSSSGLNIDNSESNSSDEDSESIEDNRSFEEKLDSIGHNNDFADEMINFMDNSLSDIESFLNSERIMDSFFLKDGDDIFDITKSLSKPFSTNYVSLDENLSEKREILLQEIKSDNSYFELKDTIKELKSNLGDFSFKNNYAGSGNSMTEDYLAGNDFMYSLNGNDGLNLTIHAFIDDSVSMNRSVNGNYTLMDYQISSIMLLKEIFSEIEGLNLIITNFPTEENSMNLLYKEGDPIPINISEIKSSKVVSPLYKSMIESNLAIKNIFEQKIINIFISDGDNNLEDSNFKVPPHLFKEMMKDSFFLQLEGSCIPEISNTFEEKYIVSNGDLLKSIINLMNFISLELEKNINIDLSMDIINKS